MTRQVFRWSAEDAQEVLSCPKEAEWNCHQNPTHHIWLGHSPSCLRRGTFCQVHDLGEMAKWEITSPQQHCFWDHARGWGCPPPQAPAAERLSFLSTWFEPLKCSRVSEQSHQGPILLQRVPRIKGQCVAFCHIWYVPAGEHLSQLSCSGHSSSTLGDECHPETDGPVDYLVPSSNCNIRTFLALWLCSVVSGALRSSVEPILTTPLRMEPPSMPATSARTGQGRAGSDRDHDPRERTAYISQ